MRAGQLDGQLLYQILFENFSEDPIENLTYRVLLMHALIEYDKRGNPVVVKSSMETTHEGWIERGKIADEAIPFNAKYTELERFNALHTHLLLTNLIKRGVIRKEGVEINPILGCLKKCGANVRGTSERKKLTIQLMI